MLRISLIDAPQATRLKLEGKLAHEWVAEMETAWTALVGSTRKKKVIVDLADVSFVDESGKELLSRIRRAGGELVGSGPMMSALIEEIQAKVAAAKSSLKKEAVSLLLLAFLAFSACNSAAQETGTPEILTLDNAIRLAKANNRQLKLAALDVEKSRESAVQTGTKRLPSLSTALYGSALLTPFFLEFERGAFGTFENTGPIPDTNTKVEAQRGFTVNATARAAQPLSQLYRINLGLRAQKIATKIEAEQLKTSELDVVAQVRQTFYQILQAQSAAKANRVLIDSLVELDRVLDQHILQKVALRSDGLDAKANLLKARQKQVVIDGSVLSAKEQLNLLLGRAITTDFEVEAQSAPAPLEFDLVAARRQALERRPEVREAALRVEQAGYDRRAKKAEYIPDVSAFVTYISPVNVEVIPKNIAAGGIEVSWEPFDWGRKKSELAQKRYAQEQAAISLAETEARVSAEVHARFRGLREAELQLEAAQVAQQAAVESLRITTNKYTERAALLREVLHVQAELAQSNDAYQQALLSLATAKSEFLRAVGEE